MEITSSRIVQMDSSKPRNKCRKWKLVANYKVGNKYKEKTHRFTGSITDAKNALDEFIDDLENGSIHRTISFEGTRTNVTGFQIQRINQVTGWKSRTTNLKKNTMLLRKRRDCRISVRTEFLPVKDLRKVSKLS